VDQSEASPNGQGGSTDGGATGPTENDDTGRAEHPDIVDVPIGTPVTDDEFRRLKDAARRHHSDS